MNSTHHQSISMDAGRGDRISCTPQTPGKPHPPLTKRHVDTFGEAEVPTQSRYWLVVPARDPVPRFHATNLETYFRLAIVNRGPQGCRPMEMFSSLFGDSRGTGQHVVFWGEYHHCKSSLVFYPIFLLLIKVSIRVLRCWTKSSVENVSRKQKILKAACDDHLTYSL